MMSSTKEIKNIIYKLQYNKEYSYNVFGVIDRKLVSKIIQNNSTIIGKTVNGKFYKKLLSDSKIKNIPYEFNDDVACVINDPKDYTFNVFWQSNKPREQEVSSIIINYLSTMNTTDIYTLCDKFGVNRVKSINISMYKEMYKRGYVNIKGMKVAIPGRYDKNISYIKIMNILKEYNNRFLT